MSESKMPTKAATLFTKARSAYQEMFAVVSEMRQEAVANPPTDLEKLANTVYAVKLAFENVEALLKELRGLTSQYSALTCVRWVEQQTIKQTGENSIKTEYVTVTPDVRQLANIPTRKKDPEKYAQLMAFLGIPEAIYAPTGDDEVVRPHFPGLVALISRKAELGEPLPPGLNVHATYPEYRVVCRNKKRDPDEASGY